MKKHKPRIQVPPWQFNNKNFVAIPTNTSYHGFVYLITVEVADGVKQYIGKKAFHSYRRRKFGKREIAAMPNKRLKKYEIVKKESDWLTYTSSNEYLNDLIDNGASYSRIILIFGQSKQHLSYLETKYLFTNQVVEKEGYLNSNINGTYYRKHMKKYFE